MPIILDIHTGVPVATGSTNSEGASSSYFAKSDHVHQTKIDAVNATATDTVTTSSVTDVSLAGMSLTPGAGNWLLTFSCQHQNTYPQSDNIFSVYINGIQSPVTERAFHIHTTNVNYSVSLQTLLTNIADGQTVEIRWRIIVVNNNQNMGIVNNRELILVRAV